VNYFDLFLEHLENQGFRYEKGFLFSEANNSDLIGFRLLTANQQIDVYIRDEFWDASKSHPKLGKSQEIAPGASVIAIHR
jgi:hypothetical protein